MMYEIVNRAPPNAHSSLIPSVHEQNSVADVLSHSFFRSETVIPVHGMQMTFTFCLVAFWQHEADALLPLRAILESRYVQFHVRVCSETERRLIETKQAKNALESLFSAWSCCDAIILVDQPVLCSLFEACEKPIVFVCTRPMPDDSFHSIHGEESCLRRLVSQGLLHVVCTTRALQESLLFLERIPSHVAPLPCRRGPRKVLRDSIAFVGAAIDS